ncbi:hypothetical protein AQPE_1581 [Aquipluma nitroreducens]|uniref:HEAT repeat domain-containing protein n=1 Tax=Aquipluma nitroreducens TaxID=2010828 RepID=A0A5K7S779_9BACT|nr:HEAT repeat domain-containing protein [Aquipluma nitroreducens]BBE17431.1 hypothetical protein AQPE_1581 [Aquipluma nitroreducens]
MTVRIRKPKVFITVFLCFIFIFILPMSEECRGGVNNQINNSKESNNLSSGVDDSLHSALQQDEVAPIDSSAFISEGQGKQIQDEPEAKISQHQKEVNRFVLWVVGDNNVSEFKSRMIDYGNNNLPLFLRKYYRQLVDKTYTYPIIILFILFIFALIINISIVLLVMYFTNKMKTHRERYIQIYRNSYEEVLSSYLFGDIEWDLALLKLKKLKKPLNRKILTSVLLVFKENLRGEMDNQIPQIFINLGLEKDSLKLTKSIFYHKRIEGLKALTNLDPENAKEIIPNYLNDSHFLVRTEAQVAYVRLHPDDPFAFLKTLTSPFPRWTQLSSFFTFRLHQVPVPAFVDYLDSEIPTIRNFSLRMIVFFQQLENAPAIYKLLDSPIEITRFLSIHAVNDLRLYEGKQMIKNMYSSETQNNKLEIIKALKNIGDEEDYDFLESIIRSESTSLKTEACRSLYYMNSEGQERLKILNQNSELEIDLFLAHVTDPRN